MTLEEVSEPEVYDVYFDVGLLSPLIKRWKIYESGLTRDMNLVLQGKN